MNGLSYFANKGYRTLVFAKREFNDKEAIDFLENMKTEDIEKDFNILGVSGVEDLL